MQAQANWLIHDHRRFEAALQDCEDAAGAGDWKAAVKVFHSFVDDLKLHMRMEDEVIYPVFREEVQDPHDELSELIDEHVHLARLLTDLARVMKNKDFDHLEESLVPLYQAMTAHNAHEERVLSRMGSQSLVNRRDEIIRRLGALQGGARRVWEF